MTDREMPETTYEPVIGLEIHVQLKTETKMFCADRNEFGAAPNTHVCPVCLGLPGTLPVVNAEAVDHGVRAALGMNCEVHHTSIFARKNYFYLDLPKGYQVSQFDRPLATDGWLDAPGDDGGETVRVRIRRIHLEEDSGKSLHDRVPGASAVDLNRAGTPLIEIVTEPDIATPAHARAFLTKLRQVLLYLGVSDVSMEEGSLRVDANVSIRPVGQTELGTKAEIKNINSFSGVERALHWEIARQEQLVRAGGTVEHWTMTWDAARAECRVMRTKEQSHDYRYFPEPDLPPLVLTDAWLERVRTTLPELPDAREARFAASYGLSYAHAAALTATRDLADWYEAVVAAGAAPQEAANWVMGDVLAAVNAAGGVIASFAVPPRELAALLELIAAGTVSRPIAKQVFARMVETGRPASEIVEAEGLVQVSDSGAVEGWMDEVIAAHPGEVGRYRGGETKLMGFFVGQVMRRSGGKADPKTVNAVVRAKLGG